MRVALLLATVAFALAGHDGFAQDKQRSPAYYRAMNNLAHQHAECAAYYVVATSCFGNKIQGEEKDRVSQAGMAAMSRGAQYTEEAGLKPETFDARLKMSVNTQNKTMGNNCSNISLIMVEFAERCKSLLEDPVPAFKEFLDEAIAEELKK